LPALLLVYALLLFGELPLLLLNAPLLLLQPPHALEVGGLLLHLLLGLPLRLFSCLLFLHTR
jgi:hypothetical protein